jgi:hypothetical protein
MLFGKAFDLLLPLFRANRFRPNAGEIGVVDRANLLLFQGAFDFVGQPAHTDEREWVTCEDITRQQLPVNRTALPRRKFLPSSAAMTSVYSLKAVTVVRLIQFSALLAGFLPLWGRKFGIRVASWAREFVPRL